MQQTILALAAILTFSFYALGRHHEDADLERRVITSEVERALTDAARNRMAEIERLAFDEADVTVARLRNSPPTSVIGRDAGETTVAHFDDIDDFAHLTAVLGGPEMHSVRIDAGRRDGPSASDVQFALTVAVRYVDPQIPGLASSVPTMAKEVHVRAVEVLPAGRPSRRPPVVADFRRVYTPAGMATLRN